MRALLGAVFLTGCLVLGLAAPGAALGELPLPGYDQAAAPSGDLYRFQWDSGSAEYHGLAQTFVPDRDGSLVAVDLHLARDYWTTSALSVELRAGDPTGPVLAVSSPVAATGIPVAPWPPDSALADEQIARWVRFTFESPVAVTAGQALAITTEIPFPLPDGDPAGPAWYWAWSSDSYVSGVAWGGTVADGPTASWGSWYDGSDLSFRTVVASPGTLLRVGGANRFETAVLLSQLAYPQAGSAGAVVLSRSDLFPDALSGAPLAAAVDGPVLITPPTVLRGEVLAEISRVLPPGGTVYVLGSYDALSMQVETALTSAGYQSTRIAGANRFETSLLIADEVEHLAGTPQLLFVATGLNFPDALAAGAAAASFNHPTWPPEVPTAVVVLSHDYTLTTTVQDYLADIYLNDPASIIIAAGGQASWAVWDAFGCDYDEGCFYYDGANRYQTAAWIAYDWYDPHTGFGLTTGQNFPDALTGAPVLAAYNWPVLLVPPDGPIPTHTLGSVHEFLTEHATTLTDGLVLGSPASVSTTLTTDVCDIVGILNCDVAFSPTTAPLAPISDQRLGLDEHAPAVATPSYRPGPQTVGEVG